MLIEVSDQALGEWDRGEACLFGWALGGWRRRCDRLRGGLGEGFGRTEGADADGWIEAAFIEWDVRVETKGTLLVGHGDTEVGGVAGPPRWWSNTSLEGVRLWRRCERDILVV
jgi:hypothetical protein